VRLRHLTGTDEASPPRVTTLVAILYHSETGMNLLL
jgi:hypothetical protein